MFVVCAAAFSRRERVERAIDRILSVEEDMILVIQVTRGFGVGYQDEQSARQDGSFSYTSTFTS
jgi:hypothetical protein